MLRMEGRAAHGALAHARGAGARLRQPALRAAARWESGFLVLRGGRPAFLCDGVLGAESSAGPRGINFFSQLPQNLGLGQMRRRGSPTMLALALFIAAGAPNAWALLVPARRVTRGSNRILSEASFEQFKLVAADAAEDDDVGKSVAIDGNTVVIGAPYRGNRGAVYVFRGHEDGGGRHVRRGGQADGRRRLERRLLRLVRGDRRRHHRSRSPRRRRRRLPSGSVVVFRTSNGWARRPHAARSKLTASDRATWDNFGVSVAIDGDTIVIGADGDNAGSGLCLRPTDGGVTYGQVAKLTADDAAADDEFGGSVAIDGDTVVVGAATPNAALPRAPQPTSSARPMAAPRTARWPS